MKTLFGLSGTLALMFALIQSNAQTSSTLHATNTLSGQAVDSNSVAPATATANTNEMLETEIFSDHFDFDSKSRTAVYAGNVRVIDPRMKLTCDTMTGQIGDSTNRFRHVVAEGNVVIDAVDNEGRPVHATSGKAIYDYRADNSLTNETVELTVDPRVVQGTNSVNSKTNTITAKTIVWDRQRDIIHVEQSKQTVQTLGSQGPFGSSTNKLMSPPSHGHTNK
jgi:lipopolysaccharide transport protein LptA